MKKFIFINLLFFSSKLFSTSEINLAESEQKLNSGTEIIFFKNGEYHNPNPIWFNFFKKQTNRKKIISTLLAFPIPGGILGLHRIYLGTKPYVPLIYIFTLGGGLFILPIIDFCVLVLNKDISRFENDPRIFMWIDNEKKSSDKKTESK